MKPEPVQELEMCITYDQSSNSIDEFDLAFDLPMKIEQPIARRSRKQNELENNKNACVKS